MSEIVRASVAEDMPALQFPKRCPGCSKTKGLRPTTSRVGRVKSMRPNLQGGMTMKSDVLYLSIPLCPNHANANQLANWILEKSPLMYFLRFIVYIGLIFFVLFAFRAVVDPKAIQRLLDLGPMALLPVIGFFGTLAILWARSATKAWPMRFDPDMDVLEIRFKDEAYAEEFRKANPDATDLAATEAPPWYMRSLLWKVVILVGFFWFMVRMTSR